MRSLVLIVVIILGAANCEKSLCQTQIELLINIQTSLSKLNVEENTVNSLAAGDNINILDKEILKEYNEAYLKVDLNKLDASLYKTISKLNLSVHTIFIDDDSQEELDTIKTFIRNYKQVLFLNKLLFEQIIQEQLKDNIKETERKIKEQLSTVDSTIKKFQDSLNEPIKTLQSTSETIDNNVDAILNYYQNCETLFLGTGVSFQNFSFNYLQVKIIPCKDMIKLFRPAFSIGSSYSPAELEEFGFSADIGVIFKDCIGIELGGFKLNNSEWVPRISLDILFSRKDLIDLNWDRRRGFGASYFHSFQFSK